MGCRSAAPSPPWGCAASFVHPAAGSYPTRSQDLGQPKLSSAKLDFVQLDVSVQLSADTTIGILFAGLFALGVALLPVVRHVRLNLEDLLLGQVLGASAGGCGGDRDSDHSGGSGSVRAAQPVAVHQL
ncbi:MAG: hypothetical protein F4Z18_03880 [Caldilineaceae bacterium SB0666_bin_21]|nr:hypothetical protein [Caldilineaceae bacterium SB0666_bin_21]